MMAYSYQIDSFLRDIADTEFIGCCVRGRTDMSQHPVNNELSSVATFNAATLEGVIV